MPEFLELITDIGGSSSRWALLSSDGDVRSLSGAWPGFNPSVQEPATFVERLGPALRELLAESRPTRLTVYGAGCGTEERKLRMRSALNGIVTADEVIVESDLLGAARGLCGDASGLVLILGTGMNAGWYDGAALHTPMPSLGWILGDEGSGADIGKHLLTDGTRGAIPELVMRVVFGKDSLSPSDALGLIGSSPTPNSAVASLAGKLAAAKENGYVKDLLADRFAALGSLLAKYFGSHAPCSISATGGIASGFSTALKTSLDAHGFDLTTVLPDPMEGLIAWHRQRMPR